MSGGVQSVGSNIAFGTTDLAHRVAADILAAQFLQKTTDTQKQQSKALGAWRGSSKSGVELFVYYQQQQKEREQERIPRPLHIERVQVLLHNQFCRLLQDCFLHQRTFVRMYIIVFGLGVRQWESVFRFL
eukprot:TRINITY_DN3903_c0_g2_i3.p3 TRINITY_DN3903_c0_g2~~TRINITY_DN3903_c0_g2_i3.p3  ORF type:complete len:130 (+),score=20.01 TRINITY_DN3903_c0_g2_i3:199-588(+)